MDNVRISYSALWVALAKAETLRAEFRFSPKIES
jgi:hypothetical protein